jgi:hypothetical protein
MLCWRFPEFAKYLQTSYFCPIAFPHSSGYSLGLLHTDTDQSGPDTMLTTPAAAPVRCGVRGLKARCPLGEILQMLRFEHQPRSDCTLVRQPCSEGSR